MKTINKRKSKRLKYFRRVQFRYVWYKHGDRHPTKHDMYHCHMCGGLWSHFSLSHFRDNLHEAHDIAEHYKLHFRTGDAQEKLIEMMPSTKYYRSPNTPNLFKDGFQDGRAIALATQVTRITLQSSDSQKAARRHQRRRNISSIQWSLESTPVYDRESHPITGIFHCFPSIHQNLSATKADAKFLHKYKSTVIAFLSLDKFKPAHWFEQVGGEWVSVTHEHVIDSLVRSPYWIKISGQTITGFLRHPSYGCNTSEALIFRFEPLA